MNKNQKAYIIFLHDRAIHFINIGNHKKAIQLYNKILKIEPNDFESLVNKATTLSELGKFQDAIKHYDMAEKIHPYDFDVLYN